MAAVPSFFRDKTARRINFKHKNFYKQLINGY